MFFRFAAALLLVVLVSMAGVRLEKETLELRRAVSVQYYQTDLLLEMLVRLRLETQRLTAPAQLTAATTAGGVSQLPITADQQRRKTRVTDDAQANDRPLRPGLPMMRFQHPFNPRGID